jgi:hypothetical protein
MYFRGPQAVYVNLYVPSTLRWTENNTALSLTQEGDYPFEDRVSFTLTATQPTEVTLHFRIPAWAEGASILVNGQRQKAVAIPGQFASIRRTWADGDRVDLELPLKMRLESLDSQHANTVALVRGPLVLMALKPQQESPLPKITRDQLLTAKRIGEREWQAQSPAGPVTLLPFTGLGDRPYTTYLQVT